ncbi:autotransporter outer membrane beta-barrel domain-containing protein [Chachezhania sediminis]|uniref:autotransporter outer membrane beta-barrel domain-containing protein n=1 Tax=Chachezhania sediminis TaxID=2599291 RepID=UPI00131DCBD4|nr:autotransporter outer membrane beta-barrel domain-containing protein [Chachezhania sediminis]
MPKDLTLAHAGHVSLVAVLLSTTAIAPAYAGCSSDGNDPQSITCTGDVGPAIYNNFDPDVVSITIESLTDGMVDAEGHDAFIELGQSGITADRTISVDLDNGHSLDSNSGGILSTVSGPDGTDYTGSENEHYGTANGKDGGDGGSGGSLTVTFSGEEVDGKGGLIQAEQYPLLDLNYTGGAGGAGQEGHSTSGIHQGHGGDGGTGGKGGDITVTLSEDAYFDGVITPLQDHAAISILSTAGDGGDGGEGRSNGAPPAYGGTGGNGGDGGDVKMTAVTSRNDVTTNAGPGILMASQGGNAGNGGKAETSGGSHPGGGGSGGNGGDVTLDWGGSITTTGDDNAAIFAQTSGGTEGSQGDSSGVFHHTDPAKSGDPGEAGTIDITLQGGTLSTSGNSAFGIMAHSVGGKGSDGTNASGIVSYGSSGGSGGAGNTVTVGLSGSTVTTTGQSAIGVIALSAGGGGGTGGSASGIDAIGGYGGGGGNGGDASLALSQTTVTTGGMYGDGVTVLSVGGGGGNSGGATGIVSSGSSAGPGGDGATATMTSSGSTVKTTGDEAAAIVVASVGGGGGNSHSTHGLETFGASGGDGGSGGTASYTSKALTDTSTNTTTGTTVSTAGTMSEGVVVLSAGRGGGKASSTFSLSLFGGWQTGAQGASGGDGGDVSFTMADEDSIQTQGILSEGFAAVSVGGSGGKSGSVVQIDAVNVDPDQKIQVTNGSTGGDAGNGGDITDSTLAGTIGTQGDMSAGALVLSVGGGGGAAGSQTTVTVGVNLTNSTGADGGTGGDGGTVDFDSSAAITTQGHLSGGIIAASVGGSGGHSSNVFNGTIGSNLSLLSVGVAQGASGGDGGNGGDVTVDSTGKIQTAGSGSGGITALSVGGGGGTSGTVVSSSLSLGSLDMSTGASGGDGGTGGNVSLTNSGDIDTTGQISAGLLAVSVGGGGGVATTAVDGSLSAFDISVNTGGGGGDGGNSGTVTVDNSGVISTSGNLGIGIAAVSVGGGGGHGGLSGDFSGGVVSTQMAMGGGGGDGGTAEEVSVTSSNNITTTGDLAAGIAAVSVGGNGGTGGLAGTGSADAGPISGGIDMSVGGGGGAGGTSGDVVVHTDSGIINTSGYKSFGIIAASVGGHGGSGGMTFAAAANFSQEGSGNFELSIGGSGGDGGQSGTVDVENHATITTSGHYANGIQTHTVGGNGGDGGSSFSGSFTVSTGTDVSAQINVGGDGATGGTADDITVNNWGNITTTGGNAHAIYMSSVGGSGGSGGSGVSYLADFGSTKNSKASFSAGVHVGGSGGSGNTGGDVTGTNYGALSTAQDTSYGIYAYSIGGNGGDGGNAGAFTIGYKSESEGSEPMEFNYSFTIGGSGGGSGTGGKVSVTNESGGSITTQGVASYGMFGQSIGGDGGNGGNGEPDAEGWVADIYDAYEDVNSIKEQYEQIKKAKEDIKSLLTSFSVDIGGTAGDASPGGDVTMVNDGSISTSGASGTGIFAQSTGGGGGTGGDGSQGLLTSVSVAGSAKGGGDSGNISITNNGSISTSGDGGLGIYAQALGGGGGTAGDIEGSIVHEITDLIQTVGSQAFDDDDGGDGGNGGTITLSMGSGSSITTTGENAHGIWVQSAGGGGGAAGNLSNDNASDVIGSNGNQGDSGFIDLDIDGDITVSGTGAHGIFAQSASGGFASSSSGGVRVTVSGNVIANGDQARAIMVQADGQNFDIGNSGTCAQDSAMCAGTSHVFIDSGATVRSSSQNAYATVSFLSGSQKFNSDGSIYASNLLQNAGYLNAHWGSRPAIETDGTASLRVHNISGGTIYGSVVLTGGYQTYTSSVRHEFHNYSGATFDAGNTVNLGSQGYYTGDAGGVISPIGDKNIGVATFYLGGGYSEAGTYNFDLTQNAASGSTPAEIVHDMIKIEATEGTTPTVTVSPVINPIWETAPTESSLMSGTVTLVESTTAQNFDATGAKVASSPAASYTVAADNANGKLSLSYSIDYSGASTGATLNDNAQDYGAYFSTALLASGTSATADPSTSGRLQELGGDYLNVGSAAELERRYLEHVPEESLIGTSTAVRSALRLHGNLNSCPRLDPESGVDFLHQRDCAWFEAIGSDLTQDQTDGTPSYDENARGFAGAVQREIGGDLFLELGGTYETVTVNGDNFTQDGNRYALGAALKKEIGRYTLSTAIAGGAYGFDYNRGYTVTGTPYNAASNIDGQFLSWELRATGVYQQGGGFYLKPAAALTVTRVWQDSFTESGPGSLNWKVDGVSQTAVTFTPAVEFGRATRINGKAALGYLQAGVAMSLTDPDFSMTSTLVGADTGLEPLRSSLAGERYNGNLAAGFDIDMTDRLSLSIKAEAGLTKSSHLVGGSLRLEYRF